MTADMKLSYVAASVFVFLLILRPAVAQDLPSLAEVLSPPPVSAAPAVPPSISPSKSPSLPPSDSSPPSPSPVRSPALSPPAPPPAPPPAMVPALPPSKTAASPHASGPAHSPSIAHSPSPSPSISNSPALSPSDAPMASPFPAGSTTVNVGTRTPPGAEAARTDDEGKEGLSAGKKAGIAVGVFLAAAIFVGGWLVYRKRQDNIQRSQYRYSARAEFL